MGKQNAVTKAANKSGKGTSSKQPVAIKKATANDNMVKYKAIATLIGKRRASSGQLQTAKALCRDKRLSLSTYYDIK